MSTHETLPYVENQDGVFIVDLSPTPVLEVRTLAGLRQTLINAIHDPACSAIVLDTSAVVHAADVSHGTLVAARERSRRAGKPLVIDNYDNPKTQFEQNMRESGLIKIFKYIGRSSGLEEPDT